jgi:hypothetical protein
MRKIIVIIDVSFGEKYAVVGEARKAEPAAADVIMRAAVSIGFPHPEVFKLSRRQLGVSDRVLNRLVPEIVLYRAP